MFKAMILLKRSEEMSFEAFTQWWLVEHAPLARQLPGLQKAVFNLVSGEGEGEYDGVSELWFETQSDFENAYASEVGQAVAADSMARVSKRERLLVNEHNIFP